MFKFVDFLDKNNKKKGVCVVICAHLFTPNIV